MKNTIDLTPSWSQILPALLLMARSGSPAASEAAGTELKRMAHLADGYTSEFQLYWHARGYHDGRVTGVMDVPEADEASRAAYKRGYDTGVNDQSDIEMGAE